MSKQIDDGGPAFPQSKNTGLAQMSKDGRVHMDKECTGGMTLRDWFAGQALAGYISHLGAQSVHASGYTGECAVEAYRFADAMLAARKEGTS